MKKKVLISGGSGLLGTKITEKLLEIGCEVLHLSSRKNYTHKNVKCFYWNVEEEYIDEKAFEGIHVIIHLAGAGIAEKKWTKSRKKIILESRVNSAKLLLKYAKFHAHDLQQFIGASAIGFYGESDVTLKEDAPNGDSFLAEVCQQWEESYDLEDKFVTKTIFRIGLVLAKEGGALKEMIKTLPFFVGVLGSGQQIYSWIHIDDLAAMFVHAIEKKDLLGIYNAVAPHPCTQKVMAKSLAKLYKSISLPTPVFALKLVLGEMSSLVLESQHCSADKILASGFQFNFPRLENALVKLK